MTIGAPQLIYLSLTLISLGVDMARHGQDKKPATYNARTSIAGLCLSIALLWWGGFFG